VSGEPTPHDKVQIKLRPTRSGLGSGAEPPMVPTFCVLLDLSVGFAHWFFILDDLAVQRRYLMRPLVVVKNGVVAYMLDLI